MVHTEPISNFSGALGELASCVLGILPLIAAAALLAWVAGDRRCFVLGAAGSLVGFVMPLVPVIWLVGPQVTGYHHLSIGPIVWDSLMVEYWGTLGMIVACAASLIARRDCDPMWKLSLRDTFVIMTAIGLYFGVPMWSSVI